MATHLLPQVHQRRRRDVAAIEIKQLARAIVAMKPDPAAAGRDREGELGAVAPFAIRRLDLRVIELEAPDPAQCIADNRPLRRPTAVRREVLQLAAAAFVLLVVRTPWLDSSRPRFYHSQQPSPGESSMKLKIGELDRDRPAQYGARTPCARRSACPPRRPPRRSWRCRPTLAPTRLRSPKAFQPCDPAPNLRPLLEPSAGYGLPRLTCCLFRQRRRHREGDQLGRLFARAA